MGLSQTSLGNNGLRKILASANTPLPSGKSLQKTSNIAMAKVEKLNEADMSRRCGQLVEINCLYGSKSPHAVLVQCDGINNNPLYSGIGKPPFQSATQNVYSFAGDVTYLEAVDHKMVTKIRPVPNMVTYLMSLMHAILVVPGSVGRIYLCKPHT